MNKDIPTRIILSRRDFETLVRGDIVSERGVEIALADIGYEVMVQIIRDRQTEV